MKIYIYQIYFPTSKKCYIGQTRYLNKRMSNHPRSGSLVCKALYKYDDWKVSILHTCKNRDEANRIEIEEIRNFNSVAPHGYNLTAGGEGGNYWKGKQRDEETIEKMRKSAKGNQRSLGFQNFLGHKHTKEAKAKMSTAKLGKKHSLKAIENNRLSHIGKKHSNKTKIKMRISRIKNEVKKLERSSNEK